MSGIAIGIIANRVVVAVADSGPMQIHEMTTLEAKELAGKLLVAIARVELGIPISWDMAEFMEGFGA